MQTTASISALLDSRSEATTSRLRRAFWIGTAVFGIIVAVTARPQYVESAIGAVFIFATSLLPAGLWAYGKGKGLPLYPVYALTHIWTFGLPLLYEHPIVTQFPANNQLTGALTVIGFLMLGTAIWYVIARRPVHGAHQALMISTEYADYLFLGALVGGIAFTVVLTANWLNLPAGVASLIQAIVIALDALASFVLSYRLGNGSLNAGKAITFKILISLLVVASVTTIFLVGAMSVCALALFGYTVGARRFPWTTAIALFLVFAFLHAGKTEMRNQHWETEEQGSIILEPIEYPGFLAEWIDTSWHHIGTGGSEEEEEGQSLLQRASLMQLLLYVQVTTPDSVPYLNGATYEIIPSLLVPRIFNPNKPASHEGTYMLNVHFGFQTREETQRTTIGFGLLNEAYANFGYAGAAGLAIILALYYAVVGRWASNAPILSLRSLFAVIVASYSFQAEFAAGVYVAALFQSTVALLLVALLFMRPAQVQPSLAHATT